MSKTGVSEQETQISKGHHHGYEGYQQDHLLVQRLAYWITTQCLSFGASSSQPWNSTLVPGAENWLWKNSIMSSVLDRRRCCVGLSTAIEPPWLMRLELPLHIVTVDMLSSNKEDR